MTTQFESLERRMLMSAAATVVINGQKFSAINDDGFQLLIPKKMPTVKAQVQTSGVFGTQKSIAAITANSTASPVGFQITLNLGGTVTSAVRAAFDAAVGKWESIITADVPDVTGVDDIQIDATVTNIDGVGKILGQAGPTKARSGSYIPTNGTMQFDAADLTNLASSGQLEDVIFHEMGHVLGIGTIWSMKKLTGGTATDPRYLGTAAITAYKALGGKDASIPVENTGGAGTAGAHWRESVFTNEVMTGYLNAGTNLISTITIASMIDLGYSVDMSQAEPYNIPGVTPIGNVPNLTGSISGKVFADLNNNGTQDDGESVSGGRVVYLDTNKNGKPDSGERFTVTGDDGSYAFSNIADGMYSVRVTLTSTFHTITGSTDAVVISGGNSATGTNLGIFDSKASISGVVFTDTNNNGTRDNGEVVRVKATVFIDANNNGILDKTEKSTLTSTTGVYLFDNLTAGSYNVKVLRDTGISQTGITSGVTLTAGQNTLSSNIGLYDTRGAISGITFLDSDNDGVRDDGELPLPKTLVFLDSNSNGVLDKTERSVTSGLDGSFSFTAVTPGSYSVRMSLASGVNQSASIPITLDTAGNITSLKVGAFDTKGSIAGVAFADTNNNGTRDDGELVLAKNVVYLDTNSNGLLDKTERSTTTGTDGSYTFDALLPGTYKPRLVLTTGVNATTTPSITLTAAQKSTGNSLGAYDTRVSIAGIAFTDTNNNGTRDDGEVVAAKAVVFLDTNSNGILDKGELAVSSGTDGSYRFVNLLPGTYKVRIAVSGFYVQTSAKDGLTLTSAQKITALNAGIFDTSCTISGTVYNDPNQSGTRDTGETASANRIVYIDANGNGVLDKTEKSAKTSVTGEYVFTGIAAGTYALRLALPIGVNQISPSNNGAKSVTVTAGQRSTGNSFAIVDTTGSIVGSIFLDSNRNSAKDTKEAALAKISVYLDANNNGILDTGEFVTTSSTNGVFGFSGVPAGTYTARVVTPAKMVQSLPADTSGQSVTVTAGAASVISTFGLALAATPPAVKPSAIKAASSLKLASYDADQSDSLKLFSSTRVAA